ncbi:MAG: pilus assembly protein [Propionibacteriales bacterium]|nr:pilus assembly protein [Propionibacteriales bacterium]
MRRNECGAVTAETAVVLPVLVVLTVALAWLVSLGVAQARVVDAARETARAVARGEDAATSVRYGEQVAPGGSRFRISTVDGEVRVEVSTDLPGPGGLFEIPGVRLHSTAVTRVEP